MASAAHDAVVPAFYAMASPHEQIRLGIGVNVPFGLGTEYSDGWVGRYHAIESTFETVNFNPVVAVKATDWLTLAAGAQIQYAEAELTNAIDFGSIGAANAVPGSVPTQQDGQGGSRAMAGPTATISASTPSR
ncbi:MAG: outer membrane protein transport protein [Geminicoccaceae bacterium]